MPIIQGDNGETIIQFGDGDVLINNARQEGASFENEIAFFRDDPHPIGEYTEKHVGTRTNEHDCPVRLQFTKSESIGVLIERLGNVQAQMQAKGL